MAEDLNALWEQSKPITDVEAEWEAAEPIEKPTQAEAFLRGSDQGVSMGWADEANAWAISKAEQSGNTMIARMVHGLMTGDYSKKYEEGFTPRTYDEILEEQRARYRDAQREHPGTTMAGQFAGAAPTVALPGGTGGVAARVASGAMLGGVAGAGASEAETLGEALPDIAAGAALGGAIPAAGAALRGTRQAVGSGVEAAGRKLGDKGLAKEVRELLAGAEEAQLPMKDMLGRAKQFVGATAQQAGRGREASVKGILEGQLPSKMELYSALAGGAVGGVPGVATGMAVGAALQRPAAGPTLQLLGNLIKSKPERFGKFLPTLQAAASRGTQSLAATHYVLAQTDPEYRTKVVSPLAEEWEEAEPIKKDKKYTPLTTKQK